MRKIQVYSPLKEYPYQPKQQEVTLRHKGYIQTYIINYIPNKNKQLIQINIRQNLFHNIINFIKRAIKEDIVATENVSTITAKLNKTMKQLTRSNFLLRVDGTRKITKMVDDVVVYIQVKSYILED